MTTVEQVLETVGTLPFAERQRLLQQLQQQLQQQPQARHEPESTNAAAQERAEKLRRELEEYRRAKQWIAEHRAEYLNQWVVLEGDRLISHGFDGEQVYDQAKAAGVKVPFLVRISEEPKAFMTGIL